MTAYYKVVRSDIDKKLLSFLILPPDGVEYEIGKWTRPQEGCGPLCVFDSMEHSIKFCTDFISHTTSSCLYWGLTLFQCEIEPSKQTTVWRKQSKLCRNPTEQRNKHWILNGTVLADAVKLDRVVLRENGMQLLRHNGAGQSVHGCHFNWT